MGAHPRTVGDLLNSARTSLKKASVPDAELEGELLVAHALGIDRAKLFASLRDALLPGAREWLAPLLARRCSREPLAYITGRREFYGRDFAVDRCVLVPRPETELLVERALHIARRRRKKGLRIADVGTGSGVLAVTLALELPDAEIQAVDSSRDALEVARANGEAHGVGSRVTWLLGALSAPLSGPFDMVVANLPYVRTGALRDLQPEIRHEPEEALDGGPDGMRHVGPLIREFPRFLAATGATALLEIDPPIEDAVIDAAREALPDPEVRVWPDLAGLARCAEITARRPSSDVAT